LRRSGIFRIRHRQGFGDPQPRIGAGGRLLVPSRRPLHIAGFVVDRHAVEGGFGVGRIVPQNLVQQLSGVREADQRGAGIAEIGGVLSALHHADTKPCRSQFAFQIPIASRTPREIVQVFDAGARDQLPDARRPRQRAHGAFDVEDKCGREPPDILETLVRDECLLAGHQRPRDNCQSGNRTERNGHAISAYEFAEAVQRRIRPCV
jgi:hypothetical protein